MMKHNDGNGGYWSAAYLKICMCNMLVFLSFQMLLPTLPVYLTDTGVERAVVGLVVAVITVAAVLIRLGTGYALDHWNRKRIVIAGLLAFLLASLAYMLSPSIGWVIGCSIGLGIGWGILTASYATLVSDLIPPGQQGAGIGTFMLFGLASMAVGPYAGGWIYGQFGALALFMAASAVAVLPLVLSLRGRNEGTALSKEIALSGRRSHALLASIFERSALLPAALLMLFTCCYGGILTYVVLYGQQLGIMNGGIFFLLSSGASILVRPLAGKLFDRRGPAYVLVPGMMLGIVALTMLSAATGFPLFMLSAFVYGLSFGAVQPYMLAWTIQRALPERRGAANSTFLIGLDIGVAAGSALLGLGVKNGEYAPMFGLSAGILGVLLLLYAVNLVYVGRSPRSSGSGH
ncbi:MFS transporter [Paenibacillus sp. 1011MAR3C5]|uniref:MFS transporter n=1 Tax=Paenibacillus sp. 1011MAR3C5 TaxID=1675787 RepID=UPI000E6CFCB0|nr:MFS transporter [Paenibacillus sp. 1011MAR3C5]RJE84781.1 MFS transporter [Paenibacillus sp. 1011MAR3C5]